MKFSRNYFTLLIKKIFTQEHETDKTKLFRPTDFRDIEMFRELIQFLIELLDLLLMSC